MRGVIFKLWHTPGYGGLYEKVLFYHFYDTTIIHLLKATFEVC